MKQLIFSAVVLALLGGLAPALRAQSPCCKGHECAAQADACYAKELLDILQTTHSVDAFVVTLNLLADADVEPRTAIPVIVRNAERLGIFGDSLAAEDDDKPSALVVEVLGKLRDQIREARALKEAPKVCVPVQPMTPPVYYPVEPLAPPICVPVQPMPTNPTPICVPVEPIAAPKSEWHSGDQSKTNDNNDLRTPIMPPLREGAADACNDAPNDAEILRALGKPCCEPCCVEKCCDDVQIVTEHVVNRVDEPRFFPLVGPAQLHYSRWKCTVYSTETLYSSLFFPIQITRPHVEVVYIEKDHLHLSPPVTKTTDQQQLFSFYMGFFR